MELILLIKEIFSYCKLNRKESQVYCVEINILIFLLIGVVKKKYNIKIFLNFIVNKYYILKKIIVKVVMYWFILILFWERDEYYVNCQRKFNVYGGINVGNFDIMG